MNFVQNNEFFQCPPLHNLHEKGSVCSCRNEYVSGWICELGVSSYNILTVFFLD